MNSPSTNPKSTNPNPVQENIATIARMEERFLETRSTKERAGDAIGSFVGTMTFVLLHLVWFGVWILINAKMIPGLPAFDPYPFIFLSMVVSLEGVLLSTFVLMKQNRMSKRADERAHLDLQINLLAEKEVTKILQLVQVLCSHMGLDKEARDAEVAELSQNTAVETLAQELRKTMPKEE
ncbi:MAG: DUF1003 domain-containing protein [Acidobacteriota bacterium]|nr:DUF1003 domain-containing protein [Acidobacteriota bacterium]